jgi:hypothetical protein
MISSIQCSSVVVFASAALLGMTACRSHSPVKAEEARSESASAPAPMHPIGGTYCLETFAQGPAQAKSLHFTYKQSESDGSFKEFVGDLAGDNLDSTVHEKRVAGDMDREMANDKSLSAPPVVDGFVETNRSQHSTRSDPSGWSMASGGSVHAFAPWGLFIAKPNVKQVGTENVAGFDAVRYTVDTDGQGQLDKMPLMLAGGLKDYTIKGTTWVDGKQQCILQYNIDYEEVKKDGSVLKTHYEGNTTRQ